MFDNIKIFIPTKGRTDKQKTYKILTDIGLEPILVCEPQEEHLLADYRKIVLPQNNQGISYSRNFILDYARQKQYEYIVQIDDDLNGFYFKDKNSKQVKNNKAFLKALQFFETNKCYCGLEYSQFAWAQKNDYTLNRSIEVCLMLYLPDIPQKIKFDKYSKEDKDFAIQIILSGKNTVKLNYVSLSVPSIGTNKGGLYNWYADKKDIDASYYMLNKWGSSIIKLKQKKNSIDAMVNWKEVQKIGKLLN